jgi:hypothetical protein
MALQLLRALRQWHRPTPQREKQHSGYALVASKHDLNRDGTRCRSGVRRLERDRAGSSRTRPAAGDVLDALLEMLPEPVWALLIIKSKGPLSKPIAAA